MSANGNGNGNKPAAKENAAERVGPGGTTEFTHTLTRPFRIRGREHTTLTVRRPLVRDLIAADRQPGSVAAAAALVAVCADVPVADFGYMDAEDFRAVLARGTALGFFLSGGGISGAFDGTSSS